MGQSHRASISLLSGLGGGAAVTTRAAAMIVRRVLVRCILKEIEIAEREIEIMTLDRIEKDVLLENQRRWLFRFESESEGRTRVFIDILQLILLPFSKEIKIIRDKSCQSPTSGCQPGAPSRRPICVLAPHHHHHCSARCTVSLSLPHN